MRKDPILQLSCIIANASSHPEAAANATPDIPLTIQEMAMKVRIRLQRPARRKTRNYQLFPRNTGRNLVWASAATLYSLAGGPPVLAQRPTPPTAPPARTPAPSRATPGAVYFHIPATTVGQALKAIQDATEWQIAIPELGMLTLPSPGAQGLFTPEQALEQLLRNTPLAFQLTGPQSARLHFRPRTDSVEVTESPTLASPRYTEPLRNIPQTIAVIPKEIISQQGATTLTDVLRNVPGLTLTAGEGGVAAGDNLSIRGNSARNDIFVDGVRDLNPQSRDPFNLESVEVTKGPTSAITGRGSAGGAINLNNKTPNLAKLLGGNVTFGNADTRRATLDANAPLGRLGLGERTAFRFNGLWHESGVAGRNVTEANRWGVAPSLAFGLGTPTRFTAGYYKLKQDNIPDYGIPWVPATNNALPAYRDQPAPVPRETFYGLRTRDREVLNQDTLTLRLEHDFSDNLRLRNQFRAGWAGRNSVTAAPRFANVNTTEISRNAPSWVAQDRILDNQTDLVATVQTGRVQHNLVGGVAVTSERNTRIARTYAAASNTTLLNPDAEAPYLGAITVNPNIGRIRGQSQAVWLFDTAKLGEHWEANGGLRGERFLVDGVNTTPASVQQNVRFASVRGGLVFKALPHGNLYTSYGSSISPSLEGLSYNTANTAIPPEKTHTYEVGTKWDLAGERLLVTGALFRVAKDNARTPGLLPTDPPQVLAGRQVSQGLELSASGAITRRLRLLGAYTLLDARIRNSNTAAEVGRIFQNTPRNSASLWITYAARRFQFGLGPRFMGRRFGNNTNTRQVPAYHSLDGMVSFAVSRQVDLRFNVSNLTDAFYFDRLGGGHLIPAAGRYALLSTNFHF